MNAENGSEVARLRQQIASEHEAAERGLKGLAYGASKHDFITARMERMGEHFEALTTLLGSKQIAMQIIAEVLETLPEGGGSAQL